MRGLRVAADSRDADYIRSKIRPKISRASVLVCLIGETAHKSGWVNWEVEFAKKEEKGLVGVRLDPNNKTPPKLDDSGAIFVPYKKDDILRAIELAATSDDRSGNWALKG